MSTKPICVTEDVIAQLTAEFTAAVRSMKSSDGTINYRRCIDYGKDDRRKVNVVFEPEAYFKMLALVQNFTTEIAWNGTVRRTSPNTFIVTDILVYPQFVAASTVDTDQEKYQAWMNDLDDDTINSLRFQGHSHVNMSAYFSDTDQRDHASHIAAFNRDDQFFIFMVINKRLEFKIKVFDMASNTLFEDDSVDVRIAGADFSQEAFLAEAKKLAVEKKYTTNAAGNTTSFPQRSWGGYNYYGGNSYLKDDDDEPDKESSKKKKPSAKKTKQCSAPSFLPDLDSDDDEAYGGTGYGGRAGIWDDIQS